MTFDPSAIANVWVPILGALGGLFATLAGALWWTIRQGHKRITVERDTVRGLTELAKNVDKLTNRVTRLSETNIALQAGLIEREKAQARQDGRLDQIAQGLTAAVATMQQLVGSTDALWRTMEIVAPDHVRRRNGDG